MWKSLLYSQPVIIIRSLWAMFWGLTRQLIASYTGGNTREKVNQIAHDWSAALLGALDAHITVHGHAPKYIPGQAYIIMSNHTTLYDIPIIFASLPGSIRMIAKKELFSVFFFGPRIKDSEFISIDRSSPTRAHKDLMVAEMKMKDGIIIWAAPEGTRSSDGQLQAFKRGVFRLALDTNAIIIPVGIQNGYKLLPARTWKFSPHHHVTVNIGSPIDTNDFAGKPDSELMAAVRNSIINLLDTK